MGIRIFFAFFISIYLIFVSEKGILLVVLLVIYHCSHTMAGKGSSSSTWKKFKAKAKKKSLLKKKENQRCPGCLNKSCPKKFNNDEDKCGES